MIMWKWLEKTKGIKADLLRFKDEPLSGLSIVLLIILDIFIFTNVMIGVEGETAKVPRVSYHFPSECSKHFKKVQSEYKDFGDYRYGQSKAAHLRPHLNSYCQKLDRTIEGFTLQEAFKINLEQIREIDAKLSQNKRRLEEISKQYNTRLFERIAQMQNNTELQHAKQEYDTIVLDNHALQEEKESIAKVSTLEGYIDYQNYVTDNKDAFFEAKSSYRFWQPFKAYGHMLIFIVPLLLFFGYFYRSAKNKALQNEPYNPVVKIISAHISLILAIPLVWYTFGLIYHVLPKTLLKHLIEFLVEIGLISLLNYVAILLVVLLFGGLIYWIQKHTLKKKQAIVISKDRQRLISWSQCFECEYKIDYSKPFCTVCGVKLHEACSHCGKEGVLHERFCAHCGEKKALTTHE